MSRQMHFCVPTISVCPLPRRLLSQCSSSLPTAVMAMSPHRRHLPLPRALPLLPQAKRKMRILVTTLRLLRLLYHHVQVSLMTLPLMTMPWLLWFPTIPCEKNHKVNSCHWNFLLSHLRARLRITLRLFPMILPILSAHPLHRRNLVGANAITGLKRAPNHLAEQNALRKKGWCHLRLLIRLLPSTSRCRLHPQVHQLLVKSILRLQNICHLHLQARQPQHRYLKMYHLRGHVVRPTGVIALRENESMGQGISNIAGIAGILTIQVHMSMPLRRLVLTS